MISKLNFRLEFEIQILDDKVQRRIRRVDTRMKMEQEINQLLSRKVEYETHPKYGLPEQTLNSFFNDVSSIFSMGYKKNKVFSLSLLRGTEIEIYQE